MLSLIERALRAERYYQALSLLHFESPEEWAELFDLFTQKQKYGLPEILVLIHPKWYPALDLSDPRGIRKFPPSDKSARCRSQEIYGYVCPFSHSIIHIDHKFPFSKGGVTHHGNAMYLCEEHNLSKSTDIHIMDWDSIERTWIVNLLNQFVHQIERKTKKKPKKFDEAIKRF